MKMAIISESRTAARIPTITFAVYRDIIYSQVESSPSPLQHLNFADAVLQYNFVLGNFAILKNRHKLGGHSFSRLFLNNIRLTHDLRIAEEKDLAWFRLQYENADIDRVVDVPDIVFD